MQKVNRFQDYMRKTFVIYAVVLVLIVFLLVGVFALVIFNETVVQTNKSVNRELSNFIQREFSTYATELEHLVEEDSIKNVFQDGSYFLEVNRRLYAFSNQHSIKANFVLLDRDLRIVASNLYEKYKDQLLSSYFVKDVATKLDTQNVLQRSINPFILNDLQGSQYLFAKAVVTDGSVQGYLLLFPRDIGTVISTKNVESVAITDQFDNIIYSSNQMFTNNMGKLDLGEVHNRMTTIHEKYYYTFSSSIHNDMVHVTTMTAINNYQKSLVIGIALLLGISGIIILLILLVTPKLVKRNLQSFDSLISVVKQFKEGNIEHRVEVKTFAEFQTIYDEFNHMAARIQMLIQHNQEIAEKKRQMEIKHLENQFNPHFVFNVLEMLRYEILFDPNNAANIVVSFANLMRYNINYGNTEVPLQTDLKYIKDYLMLQKMRFNERLDYHIEVDPALESCKIPKLLIQPIIENSVKHGIENTRHLTININIKRVRDHMEICVEDDGQGIEAERLAYLRTILADKGEVPEHIGLYNSHKVIQLLYSEPYGLSIKSTYGVGTKVILTIPIIGDEQDV